MGTCRAMRHLKPDPVPDELIDEVIWAATRAPSPGNSQGWDFVVVTDQAKRAAIGAAVRDAMGDRVAQMPHHDRTSRLMLQGTQNLIDTLGTAPVIILVCGPVIYPYDAPREQFTTVYSGMEIEPFLAAGEHRSRIRQSLGFDPSDVVAMVCGPEVMMRFTVQALERRGVAAERIYLSLERNMQCATGYCGHCQFGPKFICKDGPVFRYDTIAPFFGKQEV